MTRPAATPAGTDREQRLLREVASLAQRLLSAPRAELDAQIQASLCQAAGVVGADRVFLSVFGRRGGPPASYEWVRPGLEHHAPPKFLDQRERFPWATAKVLAGELMLVPDPAELPDAAAAERERLLARGVKSLVTIPIRPAERVLGYQVFECWQEARHWSDAEISLVRVMSEIFASSVIARRTEEALRASEARFRAIAENAPQVIAEIGSRGEILYVGARVRELLGYEPDALRGRSGYEFLHPEDEAIPPGLLEAAARGEEGRAVCRVRHADGSYRWLDLTVQPFETERGERRFVGMGVDVTEARRLQEALRDSQAQLFQAQKMEAVGRLAGGVAHDFNNLLLVIGGNLQQVVEEGGLSEEARAAARDAMDAVDRAASLTRQLLSFSRRELVAPRPVDLNEVVRSIQGLLHRLLGEHIELRVQLAPKPTVVCGDRGQLEQVLVNLAVNARDAMRDGGTLWIRTETRPLDEAEVTRLGLERAGDHHALVVRDTGVGIDPRAADHIFEPFYTTKEPGQGTGLGLSIVYNVAQQAGGTVRVEGAPGKGATFEVILPAARGGATAEVVAERERPAPSGGRLLLVEDEPAVRRLVTRMLERNGYEVVVAADGREALLRAEQSDARLDLLITDVVMPALGGPELARRLRQRFPRLAVLFVSGYPRDFQTGETPGDEAFLAKPFTREQLLASIARLLEELRERPTR
jgi:PAS domain S-box-containing protein